MKYYELKAFGETYNVRIERNAYVSGDTLALSLITDKGEPFCDLTVNLMDSIVWGDDKTAFVDTNNCPWAESFIQDNGLGYPMGIIGRSGYCSYPLYRFDLEKMERSKK